MAIPAFAAAFVTVGGPALYFILMKIDKSIMKQRL